MRFWDASAIVPLLAQQGATTRIRALLAEDSGVMAWWGTPVECESALARLRREGQLTPEHQEIAADTLQALR